MRKLSPYFVAVIFSLCAVSALAYALLIFHLRDF